MKNSKYAELLRRVMDCNDEKEWTDIFDEVNKAYHKDKITMGQRFVILMHLNKSVVCKNEMNKVEVPKNQIVIDRDIDDGNRTKTGGKHEIYERN